MVKPALLILMSAAFASAESHPSWWTYASPEATTLVGIHWDNLRHSPFAAAIEAELSPKGDLAFPDLDCLRQAREIIISSPALLAAEAGGFPAATVKDQAQRAGLRRLVYRGVTLWIPEQAAKLGVAQISEALVLVGDRKSLEAAVDRGLAETGRQYSPLLPRAARFSQTGDLWVVAVKLPDPLAGLFVPLDADAADFLGQVSVRDGLALEASFDAGSEEAAAAFARGLRQSVPGLPAIARGVEATTDHSRVGIALQVDSEDLMAALNAAPAVKPAPVAVAAPVQVAAKPAPSQRPVPVQIASAQPLALQAPAAVLEPAASPAPPPVAFTITHVEGPPQIIRIIGLDNGTREIVLPPLP